MYDGAANIIYWHSCCVEISISVYHYHFPVSVVDEDAQRRFITNGSEDHLPEVSKDAFGAIAEVRETCLRAKLIRRPRPKGDSLAPALRSFPSQFFCPICFFQIWPRRSQMLGAPGLIDDGVRFVYVEAIEVVGDNADGCVKVHRLKKASCLMSWALEVTTRG